MTSATVSISESNGLTPTVTASITNANMGSVESVNLDPVTYPCPATGYSYEKWQRLNVTAMGTVSAIQNLRVYDSASLGTGATHKTNARTSSYGGAQTYDTTNGPQNTDRSATYGYTQTMPTSIPSTANLGIGGSLSGSLTATGYSDYLIHQIVTSGASAGTTVTMTIAYDEVA